RDRGRGAANIRGRPEDAALRERDVLRELELVAERAADRCPREGGRPRELVRNGLVRPQQERMEPGGSAQCLRTRQRGAREHGGGRSCEEDGGEACAHAPRIGRARSLALPLSGEAAPVGAATTPERRGAYGRGVQ